MVGWLLAWLIIRTCHHSMGPMPSYTARQAAVRLAKWPVINATKRSQPAASDEAVAKLISFLVIVYLM